MSLNVKYIYGLDENGILTNIEDSTSGEKYYCPACGELLMRKCGQKRRKHFAHYPESVCSPDKYLHTLAELRIKDYFNSTENFPLYLKAKVICSNANDCVWKNVCEQNNYPKESREKFNLKEFYDTCEIEKKHNEFIADLLLTNSHKPQLPPIFIEVLVNHPCTPKKINSGIRIVEISVESEEDIDIFLYNNEQSSYTTYNFKPIQKQESFSETLLVTSLFKSGKMHLEKTCCDKLNKIPYHNSVMQFARIYDDMFEDEHPNLVKYLDVDLCLAAANNMGLKYKSCNLCKFKKRVESIYDSYNLCVLYKKCGTDKKIENPSKANSCSFYRDNEGFISELKQELKTYPHMIRLPNEEWKNVME